MARCRLLVASSTCPRRRERGGRVASMQSFARGGAATSAPFLRCAGLAARLAVLPAGRACSCRRRRACVPVLDDEVLPRHRRQTARRTRERGAVDDLRSTPSVTPPSAASMSQRSIRTYLARRCHQPSVTPPSAASMSQRSIRTYLARSSIRLPSPIVLRRRGCVAGHRADRAGENAHPALSIALDAQQAVALTGAHQIPQGLEAELPLIEGRIDTAQELLHRRRYIGQRGGRWAA